MEGSAKESMEKSVKQTVESSVIDQEISASFIYGSLTV